MAEAKTDRGSGKKKRPQNTLPREAKIVAAQTLKNMGFSYAGVAENLGISTTSVENYLKQKPDPSWGEFGEAIKDAVLANEEHAATLALKRLQELIPQEKSSTTVLDIYERIRKMRSPILLPPGEGGGPQLHLHQHNEKITQIIRKAEDEAEEELRKSIVEAEGETKK